MKSTLIEELRRKPKLTEARNGRDQNLHNRKEVKGSWKYIDFICDGEKGEDIELADEGTGRLFQAAEDI